ncbi:MAG: hypothetical protein IJ412_08285 [Oscillospiraceae bacterium]|nr:hypothetical protein [Oscillospiraceae bacterium]
MEERIRWRCCRLTRCGMVSYMLIESMAGEYGAAVFSRNAMSVLRGVTVDKERMLFWCKLLAKGRVRPCHLRDVMENLVCRQV